MTTTNQMKLIEFMISIEKKNKLIEKWKSMDGKRVILKGQIACNGGPSLQIVLSLM